MKHALTYLLVLLACGGCISDARCDPPPSTTPQSLDQCYLQVALRKSNADMAYLARQICDAVFKPAPRSLFVREAKTGACVEWWLDARGRYDTDAALCILEPAGTKRWTLACQHKDRASHVTLIDLREDGDRFLRETLTGIDPGTVFRTMAACIRNQSQKP